MYASAVLRVPPVYKQPKVRFAHRVEVLVGRVRCVLRQQLGESHSTGHYGLTDLRKCISSFPRQKKRVTLKESYIIKSSNFFQFLVQYWCKGKNIFKFDFIIVSSDHKNPHKRLICKILSLKFFSYRSGSESLNIGMTGTLYVIYLRYTIQLWATFIRSFNKDFYKEFDTSNPCPLKIKYLSSLYYFQIITCLSVYQKYSKTQMTYIQDTFLLIELRSTSNFCEGAPKTKSARGHHMTNDGPVLVSSKHLRNCFNRSSLVLKRVSA